MVQKSSVKKDALLPWSQKGRVGGRIRVLTPSPQSPPPLLQLPLTLTVSLCPLTDIKEGAVLLMEDTLTDGRDT